MKGIGDPDNMPVWYIGGIFVFISVAAILAVVAFYRSYDQKLVEERVTNIPYTQLVDVAAEQTEALNSYGWVDDEQTIVHIPIEEAMKQIAAEAGR